MKSPSRSILLTLLASSVANGFVTNNPRIPSTSRTDNARLFEQVEGEEETSEQGRPDFEFSFEVPKKGISDIGTAEVKLPPLLENSELVVVRYDLPFGLSAEPKDGQVVVTKDGKAEGEKVGDILRQTTYWRGKEPGLFDVSKNADNFDLVVQALVTNDLAVADEIVLVFERPC
mmetsp:Transcript_26614/g.46225  ORF Transcript_26614/g.46225 Transcript_26614/m.46225 type:complete len:174 (+) Transcript_26614:65-586(+)